MHYAVIGESVVCYILSLKCPINFSRAATTGHGLSVSSVRSRHRVFAGGSLRERVCVCVCMSECLCVCVCGGGGGVSLIVCLAKEMRVSPAARQLTSMLYLLPHARARARARARTHTHTHTDTHTQ